MNNIDKFKELYDLGFEINEFDEMEVEGSSESPFLKSLTYEDFDFIGLED